MNTSPAPAPAPSATPDSAVTRVRQLFRQSLAAGLLNPLLHIVSRYRQERPQ